MDETRDRDVPLDYRSDDDAPCDTTPSYTIRTLYDLPALVKRLR